MSATARGPPPDIGLQQSPKRRHGSARCREPLSACHRTEGSTTLVRVSVVGHNHKPQTGTNAPMSRNASCPRRRGRSRNPGANAATRRKNTRSSETNCERSSLPRPITINTSLTVNTPVADASAPPSQPAQSTSEPAPQREPPDPPIVGVIKELKPRDRQNVLRFLHFVVICLVALGFAFVYRGGYVSFGTARVEIHGPMR